MRSVSLVWEGLAELKAALLAMPGELANDAGVTVEDHADRAANAIRSKYEAAGDSGKLARGVRIDAANSGRFGAAIIVRSTAKIAYVYENGSQVRHNVRGANRGQMPPAHVFVPIVVRMRRSMYDSLSAMLEDHGLIVSGQI